MEKKAKSELAIVEEKIVGMRSMLAGVRVTNDDELNGVADKVKQIKTMAAFIKQEKEKLTKPAEEIMATARERYDPYIKECANAEAELKDKAKRYMLDREADRKEKEDKIAERVENKTLKPETAIKKLDNLPEAPKTVRTDTGSGLRMSKRKVAVIDNPSKIPDEFWVIDEVRVRREALDRDKKGLPQIPGVVIREEVDLSSL